jgi:PAS domain S-box-containing protein
MKRLDRYAARYANFVLVVTRMAVLGEQSAPKGTGEPAKAPRGYQGRSPWLVVPVVVMMLLGAAGAVQAQGEQKRVLMLSEFRPDTPSNIQRQNILRDSLNEALKGSVDYYEEFIDAPAFSERDHELALRDFFRRKYGRTVLDVVMVVGRTALEFVRTYGVELFPGVPVVALAIDRELIEVQTPGLRVTGVARLLDPKGTLDFILTLQPDTTEVVVVAGGLDARYYEVRARRELRGYEGKVAFTYLIDVPFAELLARVANVPPRAAIMYLGVTGDGSGTRVVPSTALAQIVARANAPVYGSLANQMDQGIVGGSLHDTNIVARETAEVTLRLLRGESITNIPIQESQSVVTMANWPALRRWGLSESRLPTGTLVLRREPSLWSRYRWEAVTVLSLLAAQGVTIVALFIQRTRRKAIEQRNTAILRAMPDLMFLQTGSGVFVDYHAHSAGDLAAPPSVFLGKSMREVMPPFLVPILERAICEALSSPEPVVVEYWLRIAGEMRHFEARIVRCDANHVLSVVRDTTERKHAEQALQTSHERYALATAAGSVGVWDWNLQTNDFYVDSSLRAALGYEAHEIGNRFEDWRGCVHPDDVEAVMSRTRTHIASEGSNYEDEYRMVAKDGRIRWWLARGSVSERIGTEAIRMTGTYTDITARKQAEDELHHAKAELARLHRITTLSEVSAALAHEINQPLTAIVTNATACIRMLARPTPDIVEVREALRDVIQDGKRASDIVRQMRQVFTRHEGENTPVDVNALILDSCTLAHDRLHSAHILLRIHLTEDLPFVRGDQVGLQQVLWNLVTNAIDSMRDSPQTSRALTITSSVQAGAVHVAMHDTGPGVSEADLQRVFEPFFTTKPDGMGMGLSISRSIVEAHGGRLWVELNGSQGAVFCFSLPAMTTDDINVDGAIVDLPGRTGGYRRADRSAGVSAQ